MYVRIQDDGGCDEKFTSLVARILYDVDPIMKIGIREAPGYAAYLEGSPLEYIQDSLIEVDDSLDDETLALLEEHSAGAIIEEDEDSISVLVFDDEGDMERYWEGLESEAAARFADEQDSYYED